MTANYQAPGLIIVTILLLGLTDGHSAEYTDNDKDVFEGFYRLEQIDVNTDPALVKIMHHIENNKGPISVWQSKNNSNLVYMVDFAAQSLTIIDADNQPSLEQPIPIKVGRGAISVVANRDDSVAFVTNLFDGTLSVVDVMERKVSGILKFKADSQPYCQIFGKDESRLYVVTRRGDSVFVVDPVKRNVIDTLGVKDLSRDVQLKHCYGSCHDDKRAIMRKSLNRKPTIPNNVLSVPAAKLNGNGLRADQHRRFLLQYHDYLTRQESRQKRQSKDRDDHSPLIEVEAGDSQQFSDELSLPDKMTLLDIRNRNFSTSLETSY